MFLLSQAPIRSPVQWISKVLSPEEKWPSCEADALPPSSAEVKMRGAVRPLPTYAFAACMKIKM
jgi:hypothetical protein